MPLSRPSTSSGAPDLSAIDFLVKTASGDLSAERVVTNTSDITWDWATAAQAKASLGFTVSTKAKEVLDDTTFTAMRKTMRAKANPTEALTFFASPGGSNFDTYACRMMDVGTSFVSDVDGYWRRHTTGAVSGNLKVFAADQCAVAPQTGMKIQYVLRTDANHTTNTRLVIGQSNAGHPGDVNAAPSGVHCIFVKGNSADGDTQFMVCTNDGSGAGTTSAGFGPVLANNTVYRITFEWTTSNTCVVTVEDLNAGTSGSITVNTDMPTQDMLPFIDVITKTSAARYFDFGGMYGERPFRSAV